MHPAYQKDSHQIIKYIGHKPRGRQTFPEGFQMMCLINSFKPESGSGAPGSHRVSMLCLSLACPYSKEGLESLFAESENSVHSVKMFTCVDVSRSL